MEKIIVKCKTKVHQYLVRYMAGLMLTKSRRTCSNMGRMFGVSHDTIRRFLMCGSTFFFPEILVEIANEHAKQGSGWVIIDDTHVTKEFAQWIECLSNAYSTLLRREVRGISLVVVAWSNGRVTIPLSFAYWYKKEQVLDDYKTKKALAQELIAKLLKGGLTFDYLLADGLYFSVCMAAFLSENQIKFDMRSHSNRSVTIYGQKAQLRYHPMLKLSRNQRKKTLPATWHDHSLFFTVHKRRDRHGNYSIVYQVSNYNATPETHINRYTQRWEIEKMFRTMKQKLGLAHCAARKIEAQTHHFFAVFLAYTFLQLQKQANHMPNPEAALYPFLHAKPHLLAHRISSFSRNFQCFA